jgi:alkylhydroperoxidase family enzyme
VPAPLAGHVEVLGTKEAWERLPPALRGGGGPLPAWARALAASLPRTTAAMLRADYLHRAGGPLEPTLRGRLRWVAARANRCRYSEAAAEADLRRAGLAQREIRRLGETVGEAPLPERAALNFARKLTLAADSVTDEEVERLLGWYGEERVVAMAMLVGHACFQDRLILAQGLPPEPGGGPPPAEVRFVTSAPGEAPAAPARQTARRSARMPAGGCEADAEWRSLDFAGLQQRLARQRDRRSRIRLPAGEGGGNRWGLVCRAYQPELAAAWSACTEAFEAEADPDPVLAGSLFWVVTRAVRCFY